MHKLHGNKTTSQVILMLPFVCFHSNWTLSIFMLNLSVFDGVWSVYLLHTYSHFTNCSTVAVCKMEMCACECLCASVSTVLVRVHVKAEEVSLHLWRRDVKSLEKQEFSLQTRTLNAVWSACKNLPQVQSKTHVSLRSNLSLYCPVPIPGKRSFAPPRPQKKDTTRTHKHNTRGRFQLQLKHKWRSISQPGWDIWLIQPARWPKRRLFPVIAQPAPRVFTGFTNSRVRFDRLLHTCHERQMDGQG